MTCAEAELLLNAYVDNELTLAECAAVQTHVDQCTVCLNRRELLTHLKNEIAASNLSYTPPDSLARKLRHRRPWTIPVYVGAAAALLAVAFVIPVRQHTPDLQAEVLQDHSRSLLPNHLIDAPSSDRHTVKPWFQGKADVAPLVPDLGSEGFTLTGGRLDIVAGHRVPAIVYARGKHLINVFELPSTQSDSKPQTSQVDGFNIVHWTTSGIDYWAVSDVNPADLQHLAALMESAK